MYSAYILIVSPLQFLLMMMMKHTGRTRKVWQTNRTNIGYIIRPT